METTDANNDNIKVFHDKLNSWYVAKTERRASSEIGKDAPTALTKRRGPPKVIVDDKSVSSTGNSSGQGDSGASIKKYVNFRKD